MEQIRLKSCTFSYSYIFPFYWVKLCFACLDGVRGVVLRGQGRTHQPNTHCVPGEPQVKRTRLKRWNLSPLGGKFLALVNRACDSLSRGNYHRINLLSQELFIVICTNMPSSGWGTYRPHFSIPVDGCSNLQSADLREATIAGVEAT